MVAAVTTGLEFEAPGPGCWELDRTHWPRPMTRLFASLYFEPFARGFSESMRRYGLLIRCPRLELVSGFLYARVDPAPEHEVPERFESAARAVESKLWREDMRRWDEEVKPASIRAHRALQRVEPSALRASELLEHVQACATHLGRMCEQHQRFIAPALFPTGDFLVQGSELCGLPPAELLGLLRGSAPVSAAASDGLDDLVGALRADEEARAILGSSLPGLEILALLLGGDSTVARALRAYLDMVECRPLDGFDLSYRCAFELPEVLLRAVRSAVERERPAFDDDEQRRRVRDRVPEHARQRFDELLAEARYTYRLRDERSVYSDIWAIGLLRRAVLAAGARLAASGRVADPEHLLEADFSAVLSLLRDGSGPSATELAARAHFRESHSTADAPPLLGDAPKGPPPLDGLPAPVARMMRAVGTTLHLVFAESEAGSEARVVRGLAASPGTYEGTARLLTGPEELGRLQRGDVLVTASTSEAFNVALPLVGAIVTDAGGLLSHAAIVSREYGIPGVVGTRVATRRIPDGARVRVDGGAGLVELLA